MTNPVVGRDGSIYAMGWFNKYTKGRWLQQFRPDFVNGNSDLAPPFLGKTTPSRRTMKSEFWGQMAAGGMGQLLVSMRTAAGVSQVMGMMMGVAGGSNVQAVHHDLGAFQNPSQVQPSDAGPRGADITRYRRPHGTAVRGRRPHAISLPGTRSGTHLGARRGFFLRRRVDG